MDCDIGYFGCCQDFVVQYWCVWMVEIDVDYVGVFFFIDCVDVVLGVVDDLVWVGEYVWIEVFGDVIYCV